MRTLFLLSFLALPALANPPAVDPHTLILSNTHKRELIGGTWVRSAEIARVKGGPVRVYVAEQDCPLTMRRVWWQDAKGRTVESQSAIHEPTISAICGTSAEVATK